MKDEVHENFEDIIEDKIFRYKYRMANHLEEDYFRRDKRRIDRFMERAKTRSPKIEQNLHELFQKDAVSSSIGNIALDYKNVKFVAREETRVVRDYMIEESIQQYKDFYETDAGE